MNSIDPMIQSLNQINRQPPPVAPQMGGMGAGGMMDATNPITQQAQQVNLPNMPKNPLNGQVPVPGGV
jgi:hypothetical protein